MATDPVVSPISPVSGFKLDQDRKRDVDHRRKYAYGTRSTNSRDQPANRSLVRRAAYSLDDPFGSRDDLGRKRRHNQDKMGGKHPVRFEREGLTTDESAEEDAREAMACQSPAVDADIAYSFDAPAGPSHGSQILGLAINQAVSRFENKATEKLVRDEYDVVADADKSDGYAADEDEFELV